MHNDGSVRVTRHSWGNRAEDVFEGILRHLKRILVYQSGNYELWANAQTPSVRTVTYRETILPAQISGFSKSKKAIFMNEYFHEWVSFPGLVEDSWKNEVKLPVTLLIISTSTHFP